MRDRFVRLRRWAVAAVAGATVVGGVAVVGGGTAFAATSAGAGSTLVASTQPIIASTGANQNAGNLVLTLASGTTWATGDNFTISVTDSAASATKVSFASTPTIAWAAGSGCTNCNNMEPSVVAAANTATISLSGPSGQGTATNGPETLTLSGITYSTTGAAPGPVKIATTFGGVTPTASSSNANVAVEPAGNLKAATTPPVGAGQNNQAAGNWTIGLAQKAGLSQWATGDKITVPIADTAGANCVGNNPEEELTFASAPTAAVTTTAGQVSTTPTLTASLASDGTNCAPNSGVNDELVLTFTNSGQITGTNPLGATQPITITVSGVSYNVTKNVPLGNITVGKVSYNGTQEQAASNCNSAGGPGTCTAGGAAASNAVVVNASVSSNSPAVALASSAADAPISNVVITESQAGAVTGAVTLVLSSGTWDVTSTPTVTATGGAATSAVTGMGTNTLTFTVTTPSTSAGTFTVSGLAVDAPATTGPVTLTVADGTGTVTSTARAYSVVNSGRIQGSDADATAIAEVQQQYTCATINNGANTTTKGTATIVLATDGGPYDALAASFMAGHLGTGILLTPTASLSSETAAALRQLGIGNVIVVGGPVAVSNTVVSQLQATQAYDCNGNPISNSGTPQMLNVSRVYGATALDTANAIATYFGAGAVSSSTNLSSAYGKYNDTTGTASASGPSSGKVAILATDNGFQDAVAASAAAYASGFPVLLTDPSSLSSQASSAITNMNITQVIVMGGPVAISNNVVTQLQALGVSVIRIAGQDLTDTAQQLAQFELAGSNAGLGWNNVGYTLYVARGDFYSDGLVGGVLAGATHSPLVLTFDPNTVGSSLAAFLNTAGAGANGAANTVAKVVVLGGVQAITPTTLSTILSDVAAG